eukprot:TRINITY_DN3929_c0_g1_i1.p1 TRINITY_DN3929_c0_g1~~TRINITY_DN3929_c0_g1_i1.p1  ORF type:complete len:687 (-),score=182.35 TRINITY_DN3929_c0_g1_i1:197-2230(-)
MTDSEKAINTIRVLCADMVQKANSGHPGAPMGMAPLAYLLWKEYMSFNPKDSQWSNRDRFVLSNGHACSLQYAMLHLTGYTQWTMEDLKSFRQLGSQTPGHPETGPDKSRHGGIEVSTGPLGQGLANAVGLAIGEAHLAATYNKPGFNLVDHFTYAFCGDGCLMEGITAEASSMAGHLGLGKLIVLYDDNKISIDGGTDLAFTENVGMRYESYGWHVIEVPAGDTDLDGVRKAIDAAKLVTDKPSMIKVRLTIGFGSSKAGTSGAHGSPLGPAVLAEVKKQWGFDPEQSFVVSDDVYKAFDRTEKGAQEQKAWDELFAKYETEHADLAKEYKRRVAGELPEGWKDNLPTYTDESPADATRKLGQAVFSAIAPKLVDLIGGSADLNPSCLTYIKGSPDFQKDTPEGRNIRYGVREHAMAAITNGLAAYGGFIPYCSTFLNFLGYCQGAVTLSALSELRTLYVFTHDSIGLGEDGPTHQPVEKFAFVRASPNTFLFRPADGRETVGTYIKAIETTTAPAIIALSRQSFPTVVGTSVEGVSKGAYVCQSGGDTPDLVLVATGSELHLIDAAAKVLREKGLTVRIVSFPCWKLFDAQSAEYRASVFPASSPVLSVEAGVTFGWERYAHSSIGVNSFGASGPLKDVLAHFGFTTSNVAAKGQALVDFYKGKTVPQLANRPSA